MSTKIAFSAEQTEEMRAMRRNGKSYVYVAGMFKCSTATIRRALGTMSKRRYEDAVAWKSLNLEMPDRGREIPVHVTAERDVRLATAPRDLTASFFSDPLPGYSALDKKLRESQG